MIYGNIVAHIIISYPINQQKKKGTGVPLLSQDLYNTTEAHGDVYEYPCMHLFYYPV